MNIYERIYKYIVTLILIIFMITGCTEFLPVDDESFIEGISKSTRAPTLTNLSILASSDTILPGETVNMTLLATYDDNTTNKVTSKGKWTVTNNVGFFLSAGVYVAPPDAANKTHVEIKAYYSDRTAALQTTKTLIISNTNSKIYYLDAVNGSDLSDGLSPETAKQTIAGISNISLQPGDQILFKRGSVWREKLTIIASGTEESPIVIGAYGNGDAPEIRGTDQITTWESAGTNMWKAKLSVEPKIIFFDGQAGTKPSIAAELQARNEWYWQDGFLYIYSEGEPSKYYTQSGIEAGSRNTAILVGNSNYVNMQELHLSGANYKGIEVFKSNNITLQNITIDHSAGHGIDFISSGNSIIDSCKVSDVTGDGIRLRYTIIGNPCDHTIIRNNTVQRCILYGINTYGISPDYRIKEVQIYGNQVSQCGSGIYLHYTDASEIYQNKIFDNNNVESYGEGQGIAFQTASNNKVYKNEIYTNRTHGIEVWGGASPDYGNSDDNQFFYNKIYGNGTIYTTDSTHAIGGIKITQNYCNGAQIYYNIFYNNAPYGVILGKSNNAVLYNNVIWGNEREGLYIFSNTTGWTVMNNILANNCQKKLNFYRDKAIYELATGTGINIIHEKNCYYPGRVQYNGTIYTPSNLSAFEPSGIFTDPKLTSPETGNFTLISGSPCIDTGVYVGLTKDFQDNYVPQDNGVDLGAYEY